MRETLAIVSLGAVLSSAAAAEMPSEIVTHPDLEVSLFAMEPDVVDPVALCFDADGRMYVIEMRDYPYGIPPENKPGGTVRLLEDTDNDGRADRSELFAEDLSFPTSIAPYRDGLIVAAPPEIVYLKDTDHDGKADVREVLYRDFRRGVTDGNMSGLRWGLDNWLHGVNGGPGGTVRSTRKADESLNLGRLDFKLQPDTGDIETTFSTGGGFGLVFDQWGRSFTPHNINHMQMRIIEAKYLGRNPRLPPIKGTESISDHGEMARIYAISEAQTRPNHPEQAGYFSSSGGVGFIGHEDYPSDLPGSVTVCDVVGNLVHRDVLSPDGAVLKASRSPLEQESEFIASTDIHFRPTGLELGPDGALYLLDMHRAVIEHPDYIPKRMLETMDIREGDDQGRIYRIIPKKGVKQSQKKLSSMSPEDLVEELGSPNQWRRMTAQRILVEKKHRSVTKNLVDTARGDAAPLARVHSLWTLDALDALDIDTLVSSFNDSQPGVRESALFLTQRFIDSRSLETNANQLLSRLSHLAAVRGDSIRVGAIQSMLFGENDSNLADFITRNPTRDWALNYALSSLGESDNDFVLELLEHRKADQLSTEAMRTIGETAGATMPSSATGTFGKMIGQLSTAQFESTARRSFLTGMNNGLSRNGNGPFEIDSYRDPLRLLASNASTETLRTIWSIEQKLGLPDSESKRAAIAAANKSVVSDSTDEASRIEAVQTIALASTDQFVSPLLNLFDGQHSQPVQGAALDVLRNPTDLSIANGLLDRWRTIHPALKREVVLLMLRKRPYHDPLLSHLEDGSIQVGELNLDLEDRRRLLRWSTKDIHNRAEKLLGDGEYGNRQAKVEEWLNKLPDEGNASQGRTVFDLACAQCHKVAGEGFDVGPDLTGMSHRSVEDLASNIIDPNMAINPNYFSVSVETNDGELHTGILTAETQSAVTLLQAQGITTTLNRSDIQRLESTGTSLMPEGLEAAMTPEQLRDLVAFLQR